eukprot:GGOE01040701.1.p1 GENE.GGOE01040701.1~~GGOE01040701.1.p1  ORF type:complete len:289 (-),score=99.74 GGOE01040701.1:89-895(-)
MADFLHSCAALVEGLSSIFPTLIEEYERTAYGTMAVVTPPSEGVDLGRHRTVVYQALVMQARVEACERHLMVVEDTRLHLQDEPKTIRLDDLRPTTLQTPADALKVLGRRLVPTSSVAISMYWLHREVGCLLGLLRRYIRPEKTADAITDDQFVEKWVATFNSLRVEETGQPVDPTPAPTQFIQQQVWAPSDELPASEDHEAMRRAVIGQLLKFFLFVKRASTGRSAKAAGSEDGVQLLVPTGRRKSSASAVTPVRTPRRGSVRPAAS